VNAATATPNPRSGATSSLSVLGGYNLGESNLTYTWSVISKPSGAADPTFSANGTNAAKNSVATFSAAGTYVLTATISDAGGLLATSSVTVTDRPTTQVNGNGNANIIRIVRSGAFADVYVDAALVLHQDYATSPQLILNGLGGNDSITVDYTGGNPVPANGLLVDGGAGGIDLVVLAGSSGADAVALSAGNAGVGGASFGYVGAEEFDLNVGVGSDTLACSGNASVSAAAFVLTVSGGGTLAMTAGSTLPNFTDLTVNGGATYDLNGVNQTVDSLNGNGTIQTNTAAAALTVGQQGGSGVFAGTLKDGSGALSLIKNGPGTLNLAGTNSYTGLSTINAGVIEAAKSAAFVGLAGQVRFGGGTLHVTGNSTAPNLASKFTTSYTGATSASTATFDIDANVTLKMGGANACLQTNGGGSHGGTFTKTGAGTLDIFSNNGQLDDPFKLNAGTVIVESATGLGGADNSANHVDMKNGTTLVLRQNANTNFLTPIDPIDTGSTVNVVLDRSSAGAAPTYSLNAIASSGSFTLNLTAGASVTSGVATLAVGTMTVGGNGSFTQAGNATLQLANNLTGISAMSITGGTFRLTPLTTRVIVTPTLLITGGGRLDLSDNKLIVTNPNQLGSWTGSAYTGISGLVRSGRNGGGWGGSGIVTSMPAAVNGGFITLAAARLGDVRGGIPDTQTIVFAGQTAHGGDTIVMYTYTGDSNFDGKITVDDYGRIDLNVGLGTSGWFNGDFNYDGTISVDDYGILDFNVGAQGAPFPT
jgi:autotransporter-associated beta strand protein